jgi:hypothetical protein
VDGGPRKGSEDEETMRQDCSSNRRIPDSPKGIFNGNHNRRRSTVNAFYGEESLLRIKLWIYRLRFLFSRQPRTRGAELLRLLLTANDIAGGDWEIQDGRIWTNGELGSRDDWASRARAAGLVTVWRSLWRSNIEAYWVEISEVASARDAIDALTTGSYQKPNPSFSGVILSDEVIAVTILGALTPARQNEIDADGRSTTALICNFAVANYVVTIISVSPALVVDEFTRLADLQASRLQGLSAKDHQ